MPTRDEDSKLRGPSSRTPQPGSATSSDDARAPRTPARDGDAANPDAEGVQKGASPFDRARGGRRSFVADTTARLGASDADAAPQDTLVPKVELPKGGGAIRGIGETFEANAFTGTAGLTIPVPLSPARALTPQLTLSYDSGRGNGPFGLGFSISVPNVSRRTDRGLPQYADARESDTFILAGAEDLVPVFDGSPPALERVEIDTATHRVYPYRPRGQSGFSRIERRVSKTDGSTHFRVTSRENVTSVFGETTDGRVANPIAKHAHQVLRYELQRQFDDRGNEAWYEYVAEDLEGVDENALFEKERLVATTAQAQRYLKRIHYGNRVPNPQVEDDFSFEVVFDYGEHGEDTSTPQVDITPDPVRAWPARLDAFSSFRGGFDLRTRRLCRRILVFHRIGALSSPTTPRLVRSLDLRYEEQPNVALLVGVTLRGYTFDEQTGHYDVESMPELELSYAQRVLPITGAVERSTPDVHPADIADLGATVGDGRLRLVDLDGEGIPGLLIEQAGALHYKRAMGGGRYAPQQTLPSRPSHGSAQRLMNLDGDGHLRMVTLRSGGPAGSFRRDNLAEAWEDFEPFVAVPKGFTLDDPQVELVDLDGDGLSEIVHNEGWRIVWYRSRGKEGWDDPWEAPLLRDERAGPQFARNDRHAITMWADMTGDGLSDLVLVTQASVSYWPNLGRGKFGRRIQMANAPSLGATFSPRWLRLVDVDGTGPADLVYLGEDGARIFFNESGNRFSDEVRLQGFPAVHGQAQVEIADVYGKGTQALVWSSSAATDRGRHIQTLDLVPEGKPYLLDRVRNNLGLETIVTYGSSTAHYLRDRADGQPWATRLPFPVQVIDRVEFVDHARGHRVVSTYTYHHGYFDGPEREFRGFGRVEQRDAESFEHYGANAQLPTGYEVIDETLYAPAVLTKTWFHTGAYLTRGSLTQQYEAEYWQGDLSPPLPSAVTFLPSGLRGDERREALRALRGKPLRQEVYAEDGDENQSNPYVVTETAYTLRMDQGKVARDPDDLDEGRHHGIFYCHPRETRSLHYERDPDDPRFVQSLTLRVDEFGNVQRSAEVAYPRRSPTGPAQSEQSQAKIVVSETDFVHQDGSVDAAYRLGTPIETRSFELTGFSAPDLEDPWTIDDVDTMVESATQIAFEVAPNPQVLQKRLLSRTQVRYWNDGLTAALPHGQVGTRALVHETWTMAFTAAQIADVLTGLLEGTALTDALSNEGQYVSHESAWWTRSERATFDATKFYLPVAVTDPFGNETSIVYDDEVLLVTEVTDALGNTVASEYDYRVLAPNLVTDPNENRSFAAYDGLGRVIAIAIGGKDGETDPNAQGDTLSNPTQWFTYEPFAWVDDQKPIFVHAFAREQYFPVDANAPIQQAVTYSDGAGNVLMVKVLAEPGLAPARDQNGELVFAGSPPQLVYEDTSPAERWVGTGRTVLDNKGNPVKQYEPFFSDRPDYEDEAELLHIGVTPILSYDPLGRLIRTDYPDGTFEEVEFSPWQTTTHDRNDTVLDSDWYDERDALTGGTADEDAEKRAATLTADYAANTPTASHADVLGRPVVVVEHLRDLGQSPAADVFLETRTVLDVSGNRLEVIDARGNTAQTNLHGMLGQVLHTTSVDAGDRWSISDVGGALLRLFDALGRTHRFSYDELRRVTHHYVQPDGGSEALVLRNVYGEIATDPEDDNLRGKLLRQYDGAGVLENVRFAFDGHLLQQERTLPVEYDAAPDWIDLASETTVAGLDTAASSFLEVQSHSTEMTYDALGRVVTQTTPDASITRYTYNEGGLLESVEADVHGASPPTVFVQRIDYDVYGRRASIDYGNGTATTYDYDARSFRLRRLHTTRATSPSDALQDLRYFYDPVGNIVEVHDFAQQTVYFDNAEVEPHQLFEYDSLYRLVLARGREHSSLSQPTHSDFTPEPLPHPNDPAPLRNYEQTYAYDEVGNITRMAHHAGNGSFTEIWTRGYDYDGYGNRLLATSLPGDDVEDPETYSATYTHDAHGNMTSMPHLAAIDWDHADRMQHADLGGGGDVYFQYDAEGNRVRKVRVNQSGSAANERVYLGAFELYRERAVSSPAVLGDIDLERETLHVSDDTGRIVMVETLTIDEGTPVSSPANISRYQYANHLGTATVEANDNADLISYEEFHPFGTTSYAANDSGIEVSAKRYRYIGKERDEETGLYHCGARYLAAWLGRWTAADPIELGDGVNRYAYARGNPVRLVDPAGTLAGDPNDAPLPSVNVYEPVIPHEEPDQGPSDIVYEDEHVTGQAPKPQHVPKSWRGKGRHIQDWDAYGQELVEARSDLGQEAAYETAKLMFDKFGVADAFERFAQGEHEIVYDPETGEEIGSYTREPYEFFGDVESMGDEEVVWDAWAQQGLDELRAQGAGGGSIGDVPLPGKLGKVDQLNKKTRKAIDSGKDLGPHGGQRPQEHQKIVEQRLEDRRARREAASREGTGQQRSGEGFRDKEQAEKGKGGSGGKARRRQQRNRERNVGIDEEHSRVAKGTGGRGARRRR